MNVKMAEAVTLAKIAGTDHADRALGDAARPLRAPGPRLNPERQHPPHHHHDANEATSLTQGTSAWAAIGTPALNTTPEESR